MNKLTSNTGKCGHARCAGGNGCLQQGAPMRSHAEISQEMKDWERLHELENIIINERYTDEQFDLQEDAERYLPDEEQEEYQALREKLLQ